MPLSAFLDQKTFTSHSENIHTLSFSRCGKYLASVGDDRLMIVWDVKSGQEVYRLACPLPILAVLWHPFAHQTMFWSDPEGIHIVSGFTIATEARQTLDLPLPATVTCLAYSTHQKVLAYACGSAVCFALDMADRRGSRTRATNTPSWDFHAKTESKLTHPASTRDPGSAVVDGFHVLSLALMRNDDRIIAVYTDHGIMCWNLRACSILWQIPPTAERPIIRGFSLAPDELFMAVVNPLVGVELIEVGKLDTIRSIGGNVTLPPSERCSVAFLHGGSKITRGAEDGNLSIWNITSGDEYQLLNHDGDAIRTVSVHLNNRTSLVATGTARRGQGTYIKLWVAKIVDDDGGPGNPWTGLLMAYQERDIKAVQWHLFCLAMFLALFGTVLLGIAFLIQATGMTHILVKGMKFLAIVGIWVAKTLTFVAYNVGVGIIWAASRATSTAADILRDFEAFSEEIHPVPNPVIEPTTSSGIHSKFETAQAPTTSYHGATSVQTLSMPIFDLQNTEIEFWSDPSSLHSLDTSVAIIASSSGEPNKPEATCAPTAM